MDLVGTCFVVSTIGMQLQSTELETELLKTMTLNGYHAHVMPMTEESTRNTYNYTCQVLAAVVIVSLISSSFAKQFDSSSKCCSIEEKYHYSKS